MHLLFLVLMLVLQSTPQKPTPPNQDTAASKDDRVYSAKIVSQPVDYWFRAYVVITGLLAGTGIVTLILLSRQTMASHNAERGRLDAILHQTEDTTRTRLSLELNNFGKSAARILDIVIYLGVISGNTRDIPGRKIEDSYRNQLLLADHSIKGVITFDIARHLSPEDLGKMPIITTRVTYEDIFEKKHFTETTYSFIDGVLRYVPYNSKYK
jgi:hypothetical protein